VAGSDFKMPDKSNFEFLMILGCNKFLFGIFWRYFLALFFKCGTKFLKLNLAISSALI